MAANHLPSTAQNPILAMLASPLVWEAGCLVFAVCLSLPLAGLSLQLLIELVFLLPMVHPTSWLYALIKVTTSYQFAGCVCSGAGV